MECGVFNSAFYINEAQIPKNNQLLIKNAIIYKKLCTKY